MESLFLQTPEFKSTSTEASKLRRILRSRNGFKLDWHADLSVIIFWTICTSTDWPRFHPVCRKRDQNLHTNEFSPVGGQIRPLFRASAALRRASRNARSVTDIATRLDRDKFRAVFDSLVAPATALTAATSAYKTPVQVLEATLNQLLDAQSKTVGWQDFLDIARHPAMAPQRID
jgi:hypothetical protein